MYKISLNLLSTTPSRKNSSNTLTNGSKPNQSQWSRVSNNYNLKPNIIHFASGATAQSWHDSCIKETNWCQFLSHYVRLSKWPDISVYAKIYRAEFEANIKRWGNTTVEYELVIKHSMFAWMLVLQDLSSPYTKENGYFFLKFKVTSNCGRILREGLWLFDVRLKCSRC